MNSLRLAARHLKTQPISTIKPNPIKMSTFKIPGSNLQINTIPDLTQEDLLSFPAFKTWLNTLQQSLTRQENPTHEFHHDPYILRKIDVQSIDRFGTRLGFIKLKAEVSNGRGETLPGSVFLRGGSVGMLLILQPSDVPNPGENDKRAILTIQPRVPAGSLAFAEIPAGMLDDSGSFAGGAAREIEEETGLVVGQGDLIDMTALAAQAQEDGKQESLQCAVYPSPGGSDEFIPLFLCLKSMPMAEIEALQGKLSGLRDEGEKITLKVVPLGDLWRVGLRDGKTLAAWALYQGLRQEGLI